MEPFPFFIPELGHEIGSRAESEIFVWNAVAPVCL